jgi:hypothetical protein
MTVTRTEHLQIATVSCRVGMLSVSFVPEVSVLEIGVQFMAFPRACDALITSCFLIDDRLATVTVNIRTVAGERVPSKMMNEFRHVA